MTRTVYYTAASLDGFIATPDHSLDWLLTRRQEEGGALDYATFIAGIGALAMGASTYRWIVDHVGDGTWDYDVPSWVFTHRDFPPRPDADITFTADPVPQVHRAMVTAAGERDVWLVGGGDLVGQFHDHGLLDDVLVSFAPVTLGAGMPLLPRHVELALRDVGRNGDLACATYAVR